MLRVQKMVNNSPAVALDGRMTRSQAMFGAVDQCEVLPDVAGISALLEFNRCAAACGVAPAMPAAWRCLASACPAAWVAGAWRQNVASNLTPPPPHSLPFSSADAVNRHPMAISGSEAPASRPTAHRSKRRRGEVELTDEQPVQQEAEPAAAAAQLEDDAEPADAAQPERRCSRRQAAAGVLRAVAAVRALDDRLEPAPARPLPEAAAMESRAAKKRRVTGFLGDLAAAAAATAAAEAAEAAAVVDEVAGEAAGTSAQAAEAAVELPPHLVATRALLKEKQANNRKRIESVKRRNGTPKDFCVGAAVLLKLPKCGKVGTTIDRNRITCRVVGTTKPFGHIMYRLRCNAGVLDRTFPAGSLEMAPPKSAAELRFEGVAVEGVKKATPAEAVAAQAGGAATASCRCRGTCSTRCPCMKHGVVCSRNCGCKACQGANCGNY